MPPSSYFTDSPPTYVTRAFYSTRRSEATPFRDRALSLPPVNYSFSRSSSSSRTYGCDSHYTDFDCKVLDYSARLDRQETARNYVSQTRNYTSDYQSESRNSRRDYPSDSFRARYDYYSGNKHGSDGIYPCSNEVLGTWKHFNKSAETLNTRNSRAKSPLVSRELNRYYETRKRANYIGDVSSGGACDFRYYNYRHVPYFGGSDNYTYMKQRPFVRRN